MNATWGILRLQNTSSFPLPQTRLYAEYFDEAGRICFTSVFSLHENEEGLTSDMQPGETRTLQSASVELSPMTTPISVRVAIAHPNSQLVSTTTVAAGLRMRTPATLRGGVTPAVVSLPHKSLINHEATGVLAVAEVHVSSSGEAGAITLRKTTSNALGKWLTQWIKNERFSPPSIGEQKVSGQLLVVARVLPEVGTEAVKPPRSDESVRAYADKQNSEVVLPVVMLNFTLQAALDSSQRKTETDLGARSIRLLAAGDGWSANVVKWVVDPSTRTPARVWRLDEDH